MSLFFQTMNRIPKNRREVDNGENGVYFSGPKNDNRETTPLLRHLDRKVWGVEIPQSLNPTSNQETDLMLACRIVRKGLFLHLMYHGRQSYPVSEH